MLFRQLYEPESSTYTYLIGCEETGECVLIDPVLEAAERDLTVVQELDLRLAMTIETHIHADHVSSAARLRSLTGCKVAYPAMEGLACADIGIKEGEPVAVGSLSLRPLSHQGTPTHIIATCSSRAVRHGSLRATPCSSTGAVARTSRMAARTSFGGRTHPRAGHAGAS